MNLIERVNEGLPWRVLRLIMNPLGNVASQHLVMDAVKLIPLFCFSSCTFLRLTFSYVHRAAEGQIHSL